MLKKIVLIILCLVIIAGGSLFYYHHSVYDPVDKKSQEVVVIVENGENCSTMIKKLEKAGLLTSSYAARIYTKFHGVTLRANTYRLNKNMSFEQMLKVMHTADSRYVVNNKLQIKDGKTINEIAPAVAAALTKSDDKTVTTEDVLKVWNDQAYLKTLINKYWFLTDDILKKGIKQPLEGYFFPETYYINEKNLTVQDLTTKLLDAMDAHLSKYRDGIAKMHYSVHQFLTLSSIVERETLYDKDAPIITGVFLNRIKKNMYLGSDVTVNYALNRTGVKVTAKMLKVKSPYNTYKHKGLPIGPIATIQDKTLNSVINYQKSDYYYFFAKKDGSVIYSKTYKEHQKAVKENKWY